MNLISIENLSITVKDTHLLENVSLGIDLHERIGLIGDNGTGKSTFLKLAAGVLAPDTGTVSHNRELVLSMLEQQPVFPKGITVAEALYHGTSLRISLLNRYRACLDSYQHHGGSAKLLEQLTEQMDAQRGWEIENDYLSLLSEMGITDTSLTVEKLSGGMIRKAALACALAVRPNLLFLDEPTNHLDIQTIEWLENYIASTRMGCIVVTHDRYFLDATCSRIFEIDRGHIHTYDGNYSAYVTQRNNRDRIEAAGQKKIKAILRTELEWLKRGPKARAGKDRGRKQRIQDLMDARIIKQHEQAEFSSSHRRLGKKVLEIKRISKAYDGKMIVPPFSYNFKQGERIGIIGSNGSGKSTLLDMLTGSLAPDGGTIDCGINTTIGYYDQMNKPLKGNKTVLEFISDVSEYITMGNKGEQRVSAASFLEMFGFDPSYHRIEINRLSGGEKRRLYLIGVLMGNPNFLVLDEPTNDLDLHTLMRLEEYLVGFKGCILVVSHDRAFLDSIVDFLFIMDNNRPVQGFAGSCSDYLEMSDNNPAGDAEGSNQPEGNNTSNRKKSGGVNRNSQLGHANPQENQPGTPSSPKRRSERKRKLSFLEQKEFSGLLDEIDTLEEEKSLLEASFSDKSIEPDTLAKHTVRYREVLDLIDEKSTRWEFLAEIEEG